MSEEAKSKIEELARRLVSEINQNKPPKFTTISRTRSNILFDENANFLRLGNAEEERNFLNVAQ